MSSAVKVLTAANNGNTELNVTMGHGASSTQGIKHLEGHLTKCEHIGMNFHPVGKAPQQKQTLL